MNEKRLQQVREAVAPVLGDGEQIQITAFANVGAVAVKRRVATAAAVAAATGGLLTVSVRPRKTYLAMTDRQLVFLDGDTMTGRPGKLLFAVSRDAVSVAEAKKGLLTLKVDLAVAGQDKGLRIVFPKPSREDGGQVVAALGGSAAD